MISQEARDLFAANVKAMTAGDAAHLASQLLPDDVSRLKDIAYCLLYTSWNERRIRRAARYTPVIVGEWCVANNLVNRMIAKHSGDGGRSEENAMHSASIRGSIYREVAAMQRKAWSVSAGQIYWSYQLRGNRDFLPTIDPQSDTSRLDPWDFTHVWHAGWMV